MTQNLHRTFGIIATAIVVIAIVWGFLIVGAPSTERQRKFDERRVQDFQAISSEMIVIVYEGYPVWNTNEPPALQRPLPTTLKEAASLARNQRLNTIDPETSVPYEYIVIDETNYQLCASFNEARMQSYDIFWDHPAGRHCYEFDVQSPDGRSFPSGGIPVKAVPAF